MKFEGLLNLMDLDVRVHRDCLFLRGSDVCPKLILFQLLSLHDHLMPCTIHHINN